MGLHNVRNALASLAMAVSIGVAPLAAAGALERFRGTRRRFELAGEAAGVVVVIDYGHHPTEIQATLAAARQRYPGRRLWLVFQPHTYARTQSLFDGFLASCREADEVMLVATYVPPGRERVRDDALTRELAQRLGGAYVESIGAVVDELARRLTAGDVVLLMGAGDINQVAEPLVKTLERRRDALE
jgi:UDP-N-acetylmuramate--alanine ligase